MTIPRANVLGVAVSAINIEMALQQIESWIRAQAPNYVCITGVHGVMESQQDADLRQIHNAAGMVTPDGMPMVWLSRFQGYHHVQRVYGPDLMTAVCRESEKWGYSHFFYGGAPGVAERLAHKLKSRVPRLKVVGTHCPPFRPLTQEEDQTIVEKINAVRPNIVWVGISTPRQERWMAEHVGRLSSSVLIGVGAAFDF